MFMLYMTSVCIIISAGHIKVRVSAFDRNMDLFNEMKLIWLMYHLMLFTMFVPEVETRNVIGFSCCVVLVIGTIANMIMLFVSPIKTLIKYCRIKYHLASAKKALKNSTKRPEIQGVHKRRL